ncbi:MAG: glutathione transferase [Kofleriaceae bacterium]
MVHARAALEIKELPYRVVAASLPLAPDAREALEALAGLPQVPVLEHGALALAESTAISEYLAETFPFPAHPRLFPPDLGQRGVARQVMSFVRADLAALRAERPSTLLRGAPASVAPLSTAAAGQAARLRALATRLLPPGKPTIADAFCIADVDLAIALLRLVRSGEPVPAHLVDYAEAHWAHPAVRAARAPAWPS